MSLIYRSKLAQTLTCLALFVVSYTVSAQNGQADKSTMLETQGIEDLLYKKVEQYRLLYPEISFLILQGGEDTVHDMLALDLLLGFQPKSLDYEHPPGLREDLMIASAGRILLMLQTKSPSASLFLADDPLDWQAHICVLTINPEEIAADSVTATQHLSDLPETVIRRAPQELRLQAAYYLAYVVDHEAYHCLQSMYVGPQSMSYKELWGEYNHYLNELGADAYAVAMHIRNAEKDTGFADNLRRIRGLSVYNSDPNHLTCKAVNEVLKFPAKKIRKMTEKEVFEMATEIKNKLTIDYDEYLSYLASAQQAMREMGVEMQISEEMSRNIKGIQANPQQIRKIIENTQRCLNELAGSEALR